MSKGFEFENACLFHCTKRSPRFLHPLSISHVYDNAFLPAVRGEEESRTSTKTNHVSIGENPPKAQESVDHLTHEDRSLMMFDAILRDMGLQINEDPSLLDNPMDQIGDGIDANSFGVYSEHEPLPIDNVLTNRDMIFIKGTK